MKKKVLSTSNSKIKFAIKIFLYLLSTVLIFIVSFEIYNPISNNDRENRIDTYQNKYIKSLPNTITVEHNNIGYIGDKYSDTIKRKKAVFVGSSTTQSIYVPYQKKWTTIAMDDLDYWFNNCGIDGLGMAGIINEIKKVSFIKPNYVIVLIDPFSDEDINDIEDKKSNENFFGNLKNKLKEIQFFKSVLLPYIRSKFSTGIGHREVDWSKEILEDDKNKPVPNLNLVAKYLSKITYEIDSIGAEPVFISQPTPYGNYVNEQGISMKKLKNSSLTDSYYHKFNRTLKEYCELNDIKFIDGYSLKKNTDLFYDYTHFNLKGSYEFGKLVNRKLKVLVPEN